MDCARGRCDRLRAMMIFGGERRNRDTRLGTIVAADCSVTKPRDSVVRRLNLIKCPRGGRNERTRAILTAGCCSQQAVAASATSHHDVLPHQRRPRQGWRPRRPEGADRHRQQPAQAAGASGKTARHLSARGRWRCQCGARHRQRPWQNAKGMRSRRQSARREQPHQADCAQRKGRRIRAVRRNAEPTWTRPDRPPQPTAPPSRRRGQDLRQLDQERSRSGGRRAP